MVTEPGRVLYEGRSRGAGGHIRVTARWCVVNGSDYPIEELELIGVTRGRRDMRHTHKIAGVVALVGVLVLLVVAVASGWTRRLWAAVMIATVGTVAITVMPSALGAVLRRPYEIWAHYRGAEVLLFVTEDREQYGQVARALVRARELCG